MAAGLPPFATSASAALQESVSGLERQLMSVNVEKRAVDDEWGRLADHAGPSTRTMQHRQRAAELERRSEDLGRRGVGLRNRIREHESQM